MWVCVMSNSIDHIVWYLIDWFNGATVKHDILAFIKAHSLDEGLQAEMWWSTVCY